MLTMNNQAFSKIMNLLNISTIKLSEELFISQSLVSRWKTGSRVLRAGTLQYEKIIHCFLNINEYFNMNTLESFLKIENEIERAKTAEEKRLILAKALNTYLLSSPTPPHEPPTFFENDGTTFKVYTGINNRIHILNNFFTHISSLPDKPDVYIKDINYNRWHYDSTAHLFNLQTNCKNYMDNGGHIYLFSDINVMQKNQYYTSWQSSSHSNLHPTYYASALSAKTGWSYYLAKDHVSIMFFVPEENPEMYYTAIYQDSITLDAHYRFLVTQYNQSNRQIPLNGDEKLNFAIEIAKLYDDNINPMFFLTKYPPFFFSNSKSLRDLLKENQVTGKKLKLCMDLYGFIKKEILENRNLKKQILLYKEDLENMLTNTQTLDPVLSALLRKPIYLRIIDKCERLDNLKSMSEEEQRYNMNFHIVTKSNTLVYSQLGETLSDIFVKYGKWCYTFHETDDGKIDSRLTLDPTACSIRYEMFDDTIKKEC